MVLCQNLQYNSNFENAMCKIKSNRPTVLIVGGTFCPPHLAHIAIVVAVVKRFHFDRVLFVPCKIPLLNKTAMASTTHRIAMLKLALLSYHNFKIDLCEIERSTPSYMVTTLRDYRQKFGKDASITLLIGMDSFIQLPKWHEWNQILTLCHLLVVDRPGIEDKIPPELETLISTHKTTKKLSIKTTAYGSIYQFDAGHYDISSTMIRKIIQNDIKKEANTDTLISPQVREYIIKHNLFLDYQNT